MAARDAPERTIKSGLEIRSFKDGNGKILPVKGERNVLITSALPYVNNAPHLGNIIGSTLSADVYARYSRIRNRPTLYACGTDEYGTTTETKAMADGVTPQQLCDRYHQIHKTSYEWFQISFDVFGRTTTPQQTEICQDAFKKLYNNGLLEKQSMQQLYCNTDKRFLADRFVEGTCPKCGYSDARGDQCDSCTNQLDPFELIKPRCKLCGNAPEEKHSDHLFIKLGEMQKDLTVWIDEAIKTGIWSNNAIALTKGWLDQGLKPRCLTRDLSWGVPVPLPGWEGKVMYVWFDAPFGYPSITATYTDEWKRWWQDPDNVELYQFMGKDNVPFHTIMFPAFQIGSGDNWTKLNSLSTTEYLNYMDVKFSKSRGVGVFGENAKDTGVSASVWRYYLLMNRPETSDTTFTWSDFINRNNGELLGNLGNFVNRAHKFVNAKYDSVIPDPASISSDVDQHQDALDEDLQRDADALISSYIEDMERIKMRAALDSIMRLSSRGNLYLQTSVLGNDLFANQPARCARVVSNALNLTYALSAMIEPFMPATTEAILTQLNAPARSLPTSFDRGLLAGHKILPAAHLFKPIDIKMEAIWRAQYGGDSSATVEETPKESKRAAKLKAKAKQSAQSASEQSTLVGPKSPEIIRLETDIVAQGTKVREAKAAANKDTAPELQSKVQEELSQLLKLKQDLAELVLQTSQLQVTNAIE
ncbi:hypothetical protein E5Q_04023 [Mixia osmundae IAM 14324]|uniref:methionine--tRNA ligase n=1 Tax=Mixia osmundae (strain CBS 9802 / IAM 14324 / JCM 22182 / KY 12970) TaxID=764103 RepID=G7E3D5_MIXOS|nr:hypothetical protein E5Q_04023 [Mixia osmundae IAM 14324]